MLLVRCLVYNLENLICLYFHISPVRSLRSELQYMYVKNVLLFSRKLTRAIVTAAGVS